QISHRDGVHARVGVASACFQLENVVALYLDFLRVFQDTDSLPLGNEGGEQVEERRFARTGAAGHRDVELSLDDYLEELCARRGQRTGEQEVIEGQARLEEAANGDVGARGRDGTKHPLNT